MKGDSVRYGTRFGCRWGLPHDFVLVKETRAYKVERCRSCSIRKRWNKGYKERIDNVEYLKCHVRQFAQRFGSTKRVHAKLYDKNKLTIVI